MAYFFSPFSSFFSSPFLLFLSSRCTRKKKKKRNPAMPWKIGEKAWRFLLPSCSRT
ncbi:hypothetical protein SLEP1_g60113 [Rubroshorea leprosula]|uniref:Uncharacterized protein n=1 Tax=Rubroshorea leprosula TaxID=152421 RepID=A0AAV5MX99_9ROSI|nr:hypothetical protein SLEP1_g60113 [Rubroshorea leprosula]